jgi:hypothetical protein
MAKKVYYWSVLRRDNLNNYVVNAPMKTKKAAWALGTGYATGFGVKEIDVVSATSLALARSKAQKDAVKEAAKYEMPRPRSLRRFNTVSAKRSSARSTHWSRPGRR